MGYTKITYTDCIISVDPNRNTTFICCKGNLKNIQDNIIQKNILSLGVKDDSLLLPIEEWLEGCYELPDHPLLIPGSIFKCSIAVEFTSSFNGEVTEYDMDLEIENPELIEL